MQWTNFSNCAGEPHLIFGDYVWITKKINYERRNIRKNEKRPSVLNLNSSFESESILNFFEIDHIDWAIPNTFNINKVSSSALHR